ncbi:LPXTG cell wall anchor domain-containing protein [Cryobacterium melibiosiphilum]|uniref:LPXTG cell wall anchor domain-containing protein n=1 Tax=Cryobacterium melibiosiphilum TaxID=995039 RepID=A0A3A5MHT4_9MICO|nr:SpaH/EbpB family LPXTG-anchored major pilin [Cryobacterium melibiosiphilum]RJT88625.1 LPXTG cell wall anchor domain-containing protein [Cryobacterium melibiosiphilum]
MSNPILRRLSAAAAVLALTAAAALVAVAPATAVTQPGNIDPTISRTLTIHKSALGPDNGQQIGTGQEVAVSGTPLSGATFTAALVQGVDLTTSEGWTAVSALTPGTAASRVTVADTYTATTGVNGVAVFNDGDTLPLGLYLVTETALPAGATNPAAPFLVTLPFPTGPGGAPANQWIYDVHAYPKNAVTDLTKSRVPAPANSIEAQNPDLIRWAINSAVPTLAGGDTLDIFTLTDTLPAELDYLATGPTGVAPTSVRVENAAGVTQNFLAGTDYTLVYDEVTRNLTATFTPAGLTSLMALPGGDVTLTVLSRAVTIPASGIITNTATSVVNGATETVTGSTPIGQLTVFAFQSENGVRVPLTGAEYQVFLNQNDANLGQNAILIDGIQKWTTGANGIVEIPIITPGNYYVREITPPAGFQLPTPSQVHTQVVAGPSSTTAPVQNYVEFEHDQVPAFALPLTGSDGALWFTVGGVGLIAIALGTGIVGSRRRATLAPAGAVI